MGKEGALEGVGGKERMKTKPWMVRKIITSYQLRRGEYYSGRFRFLSGAFT